MHDEILMKEWNESDKIEIHYEKDFLNSLNNYILFYIQNDIASARLNEQDKTEPDFHRKIMRIKIVLMKLVLKKDHTDSLWKKTIVSRIIQV